MRDDLRSLVARMADELDHGRQCLMDDRRLTHPLADEARAVLAQPEPQSPVAGEVAELVAWLRLNHANMNRHGLKRADGSGIAEPLHRAAELLERLASPACLVLKPSPELIEAFQEGLKEPGVVVPLQPGEILVASNWRPISTAPQDGTEVLASDLDCVDIVSWEEWRELDEGGLQSRKRVGWTNRECEDRYPTHWQPLPDHPEVEE